MLAGGCTVADAPAPAPGPLAGGELNEPADDEPETGPQSTISPSGYLTSIAQIHCEQAFSCRATYPFDALSFETAWGTSVTECIADLVAGWDANAIEAEIAKGRAEFDGTAAVACLGGVAFAACTEHWDGGIQWADACYHVIVGNVPAGGTCDIDYACISSACDVLEHRCL